MIEKDLPEGLLPLHEVILSTISFLISSANFVQKFASKLLKTSIDKDSHLVELFV